MLNRPRLLMLELLENLKALVYWMLYYQDTKCTKSTGTKCLSFQAWCARDYTKRSPKSLEANCPKCYQCAQNIPGIAKEPRTPGGQKDLQWIPKRSETYYKTMDLDCTRLYKAFGEGSIIDLELINLVRWRKTINKVLRTQLRRASLSLFFYLDYSYTTNTIYLSFSLIILLL